MKKILKRIVLFIASLYVLVCVLMYFMQERIIFIPTQLKASHQFTFDQDFEEKTFKAKDGVKLNGVLFKGAESKGLIFLMHGNAGSLESIGGVAKTYTKLNYDVFILDYRGYGKSEGEINSQEQLFEDNQMAYEALKKEYDEKSIIVLGYSIGSGMAAYLASTNNPKMLILEAPYYSLTDLMQNTYSMLPTFILKYKFATNEYLKNAKMPVEIFHGTEDNSIYYGSSVKLKKELGGKVHLISLPNQGHNGITSNGVYQYAIKLLLEE